MCAPAALEAKPQLTDAPGEEPKSPLSSFHALKTTVFKTLLFKSKDFRLT